MRSERCKVTVYGPGHAQEEERAIVREVPLTLILNGRELLTLITTGDDRTELALGFLLAEGFLAGREELVSVREGEAAGTVEVTVTGDLSLVEKLWEKRTVTSGCGKGSTFYRVLDALAAAPLPPGVSVTPAQVLGLMEELHKLSDLYKETGGVHNCALAEPGSILLFRDDIGRHNAVDKLGGAAFLKGMPLGDKILLTTGRLTSEIVVKGARMGVPVLVSRSAPTTLALSLAEKVDLTLIGYVRGGKMTVYCGGHRIRN
jgi:FdhD protein